MHKMSSTQAKQAFGELLEAAAKGPVAIEKHRKVRAIFAAPEFFSAAGQREVRLAERRAARATQALHEKDRLIKHHRIAIELLTLPKKAREALIDGSQSVVEQWRTDRLCSQDYIDKWSELLLLSPPDLAMAMTSDADGWSAALRQNSPWVGRAG